MTTIFYILIAFCLFFEVLNLAACKKVFAAVEKYKDKNDLTEISPVFALENVQLDLPYIVLHRFNKLSMDRFSCIDCFKPYP